MVTSFRGGVLGLVVVLVVLSSGMVGADPGHCTPLPSAAYLSSKRPYEPPLVHPTERVVEVLKGVGLVNATFSFSYLGRHASRYATKPADCEIASEVLKRADFHWKGCSAASTGSITERGKREARGLGIRLADLIHTLSPQSLKEWTKNAIWPKKLKVKTTERKRTQETAAEFVAAMHFGVQTQEGYSREEALSAHCSITTNSMIKEETPYALLRSLTLQNLRFSDENSDTELRFYDICRTYLAGWKDIKKRLPYVHSEHRRVFPPIQNSLRKRLFPDGGDVTEDEVEALYKQCLFSHILEIEEKRTAGGDALCGLFTDTHISEMAVYKDAKDYYKKGPGSKKIRGFDMACELVGRIFAELRDGVSSTVHLRFAHAETLIPVMELFQDRGVAAFHNAEGPGEWRQDALCPMAANMMFIVAKGAKEEEGEGDEGQEGEDHTVLLLHNETPLKWQVAGCAGEYTCSLASVQAMFPEAECSWERSCEGDEKGGVASDEF